MQNPTSEAESYFGGSDSIKTNCTCLGQFLRPYIRCGLLNNGKRETQMGNKISASTLVFQCDPQRGDCMPCHSTIKLTSNPTRLCNATIHATEKMNTLSSQHN